MAYKDIVNKSMFSNPIYVADLFNQLYFRGEKIINPSYMIDGPTDLCLFKKKKTSYEVTKREADVCKLYYRKNKTLIVLCIENQTSYDKTMKSRIQEYNTLIREDLRRQLIIGSNDSVVFFNAIITYSGSKEPYINTSETDKEVRSLLGHSRNAYVIREYRPKITQLNFTTDIGILFECIHLNKKRTEKDLYEYVKKNLSKINNNPDIAYYLKETTKISDIVVEPKKIVGNEGDFMSLWTVLQEESRKEGELKGEIKTRSKIVLAMNKKGLTAEEIAKLTEIPLMDVQKVIKEESE